MRLVFILLMLVSFSMTACGEPETPQTGVSIIPTAPIADPTFTSLPRATREGDAEATPAPTLTPEATAPLQVEGELKYLQELPATTLPLQLSPDEQWLSYLAFSPSPPDSSPGPGPAPAILELMNLSSGETWQVTTDCTTFVCEFTWLANGQLLWRESGTLYVADANGQNKQNLAAREPIIEIVGATPNQIVVARGDSHFWRLYLPEGRWDEVPKPLPAPAPVADFVHQFDNLYTTEAYTTAAIAYNVVVPENPNGTGTVLLQIPLEVGTAPTYIMPPTYLPYLGTDGPPIELPVPLAGSDTWLINESLSTSDDGYVPPVRFFVDGNGTLVPQAEALGKAEYRVLNSTLSPDRRWIAAQMAQPLPYPAPDNSLSTPQWYVASTQQLTDGRVIDGHLLGWQQEPPALFVWGGNESPSLVRVSLNEDAAPALLTLPPSAIPSRVLSSNAFAFVLDHATRFNLHALTPEGTLVASTPLDTRSNSMNDAYQLFSAQENRLYLLYIHLDTGEKSLWQWTVTP